MDHELNTGKVLSVKTYHSGSVFTMKHPVSCNSYTTLDDDILEGVDDDVVTPAEEKIDFVCKCLTRQVSEIAARKARILSTVARTEEYLEKHHIPQLVQFLFTKALAEGFDYKGRPNLGRYLENLVDHCLYFRAGHGPAPILYERSHLRALIKTFDPSDRGWLTSSQVKRLYDSLGLGIVPKGPLPDQMPCDELLEQLIVDQKEELLTIISCEEEIDEEVESVSVKKSDDQLCDDRHKCTVHDKLCTEHYRCIVHQSMHLKQTKL